MATPTEQNEKLKEALRVFAVSCGGSWREVRQAYYAVSRLGALNGSLERLVKEGEEKLTDIKFEKKSKPDKIRKLRFRE